MLITLLNEYHQSIIITKTDVVFLGMSLLK